MINLSKKCPKCGNEKIDFVDNADAYYLICDECHYSEDYLKQDFVNNFECPDCGSLSGTLEENDSKLGVRCNNCKKLYIMLEKKTTVNNRHEPPRTANIPKCPVCGSTNLQKIGTGSRLLSTTLFGLGSKKMGKQWHCNNCKSDF